MQLDIKQIVPPKVCLGCDVCCRYGERGTVLGPYFLSEETDAAKAKLDIIGKRIDQKPIPIPYKDCYICSFFTPEKNACSIYSKRPFDCKVYPFMITYDKDSKSAVLVVDKKCPYIIDKTNAKEFKEYTDYIINLLETDVIVEQINSDKNFINEFQEDSIVLKKLETLTKRLCLSEFGLKRISLSDKKIFTTRYFSKINTDASCFSFASIYIWSSVLNIVWKEIDNSLCIFAGNDRDYFMLIPPVSNAELHNDVIKKCFDILSALNKDNISAGRIENIPKGFPGLLSILGKLKKASEEYIYRRKDILELKGDKFKEKRASVNRFMKNYKYTLRPFTKDDVFSCLKLYKIWARQRLEKIKSDYFRLLIEDTYLAQKTAMLNFKHIDLQGLVVEIGGGIKGYTLGYPLNKNTFVVLFETCDLDIKGLPSFIFKEFAKSLSNFKYINTLSDSGLENLKKQKESYRPIKRRALFTMQPTSCQRPF